MADNQHQIIDYKVDNSAIEAGRSSIGLRKRGERVQLKHMTPKEYRHYLYYTFNLNRFKGWNGIEKSDFAHNWQADESQKILDFDQALKYLNLCKTEHGIDGIENRSNDRRKSQKDIRKNKSNRRTLKQRREESKYDSKLYFSSLFIGFSIIIVTYGLIIKGLMS